MTTLTQTEATEAVQAWLEAEGRTDDAQLALDADRESSDPVGDADMLRDWVGDTMRDDVPGYMLASVLAMARECDADALVEWLDEQRPEV